MSATFLDNPMPYQAALINNAVPQWIVDPRDLTVLAANDAAVVMWGYPKEELIGLDARRFVVPEELSRMAAAADANRWGDSGVWKCLKKDGTVFQIRIRWHQQPVDGIICNFNFAMPVDPENS